jgi:DNA (cytosine-5)-methyltransferase 1
MIENVKGLLSQKFQPYREAILDYLFDLGYVAEWRLFNAADFGVPQIRYRSILVAMRPEDWANFTWPSGDMNIRVSVGEALVSLMQSNGWEGAEKWSQIASTVAPTLVGGSKKHGGADLGPTRAKAAWLELGVDGKGVADSAPAADFEGLPRLTVPMAAVIQGFPSDWKITGKKTAAYRQVGNAFPAPVAEALGLSIAHAFAVTDANKLLEQTSQSGQQLVPLNARQLSILSPESVQLRLRASS